MPLQNGVLTPAMYMVLLLFIFNLPHSTTLATETTHSVASLARDTEQQHENITIATHSVASLARDIEQHDENSTIDIDEYLDCELNTSVGLRFDPHSKSSTGRVRAPLERRLVVRVDGYDPRPDHAHCLRLIEDDSLNHQIHLCLHGPCPGKLPPPFLTQGNVLRIEQIDLPFPDIATTDWGELSLTVSCYNENPPLYRLVSGEGQPARHGRLESRGEDGAWRPVCWEHGEGIDWLPICVTLGFPGIQTAYPVSEACVAPHCALAPDCPAENVSSIAECNASRLLGEGEECFKEVWLTCKAVDQNIVWHGKASHLVCLDGSVSFANDILQCIPDEQRFGDGFPWNIFNISVVTAISSLSLILVTIVLARLIACCYRGRAGRGVIETKNTYNRSDILQQDIVYNDSTIGSTITMSTPFTVPFDDANGAHQEDDVYIDIPDRNPPRSSTIMKPAPLNIKTEIDHHSDVDPNAGYEVPHVLMQQAALPNPTIPMAKPSIPTTKPKMIVRKPSQRQCAGARRGQDLDRDGYMVPALLRSGASQIPSGNSSANII